MDEQLRELFKKAFNEGAMYEATLSKAYSFNSFIEDNIEQLRLYGISNRKEQLICNTCKSGLIDYPDINRRTCRCGGLGYNVTD